MKKIFLILVLFLFSVTTFADINVKGYYRKSGTYVHPYHRATPSNKEQNKGMTVKGYYRKSGTFVHPYKRINPKKAISKPSLKLH